MKLKPLLLIPFAVMALTSCSDSAPATSQPDVYMSKITESCITDYIAYSYSYTEAKTLDNKVLFTVSANFTNTNDVYYYKNLLVKFRGDGTAYTIPKSGNITILYVRYTVDNPSASVLAAARAGIGKYDILSGEVYKRIS